MKKPIRPFRFLVLAAALAGTSPFLHAATNPDPFVGRWALTIPDGGAGWLGVTKEAGFYDASLLWGGGSVVPVASVFFGDDSLFVLRLNEVKRKDAAGKVIRTQQFPDVLQARVEGDVLTLVRHLVDEKGQEVRREEFQGKRIPPLPPAPDLSKVKFGEPIQLLNGRNLDGWRLTDPNQKNGWKVVDGLLVNDPVQHQGQPHISYGNLRTDREFEDFNLQLEANVDKRGNSGIYLRGIYEVQVADSHGRAADSHGMGGLYSRITPTVNAAKPAGEWQKFDITLVNRHLTVVLNGTKIIDNAPVLGCTGGALWSDEFRPGPIYLQGDHEAVKYRNIVLRPVAK